MLHGIHGLIRDFLLNAVVIQQGVIDIDQEDDGFWWCHKSFRDVSR